MEDTVYENTTKITEQAAKEVIRQAYKNAKRFRVFLVMSIVDILLGLFLLFADGFEPFGLGIGIALVCSPLIFYITDKVQISKQSKIYLNTLNRLFPSGEVCYAFTETGFGEVGGKRYSYSQITQQTESEHVIMIFMGTACQFYAKDGFTKGDAGELPTFIKSRMS